jgi:hypothetical protein
VLKLASKIIIGGGLVRSKARAVEPAACPSPSCGGSQLQISFLHGIQQALAVREDVDLDLLHLLLEIYQTLGLRPQYVIPNERQWFLILSC